MEGEDSRRREDEDLFTRIRVYHIFLIFLACNNRIESNRCMAKLSYISVITKYWTFISEK